MKGDRAAFAVLVLAVTGLLISSIVGATILKQRLTQNFFAESGVMGAVKDIVVGHSSVHVENEPSISNPINLRLRDWILIRRQENHFVRLYYPTARGLDDLVVNGLKFLILRQGMQNNLGLKIQGRGVPSVGDIHRDREVRLWSQIWRISLKDTHPSPLVDVQSIIHFPPLESGESGVHNEYEETKSFKTKLDPIYAIALTIAGYFGMIAAWLSVGLCHRWWTRGLCFLGVINGLCVSVFGALMALDRIFGIF